MMFSRTHLFALACTFVLFVSINAHDDFHPPRGTTVCKDEKCYATLSFNDLKDEVTELNTDGFKPLPDGWFLAPDDLDSKKIVARFPWGANVVVLNNGAAYYTNNHRTFPSHAPGDGPYYGWLKSQFNHLKNRHEYMPGWPSVRILIFKYKPTFPCDFYFDPKINLKLPSPKFIAPPKYAKKDEKH